MTEFTLLAIRVLHAIFVVFMIVAPFLPDMELVSLHFILVPFLYLHWLTNDATCFLTVVEKSVRGVGDDKSFFHSLLAPVYQFHKDDVNYGVWIASYALWLVSLYRLQREDFATLKNIVARTPVLNVFVGDRAKESS